MDMTKRDIFLFKWISQTKRFQQMISESEKHYCKKNQLRIHSTLIRSILAPLRLNLQSCRSWELKPQKIKIKVIQERTISIVRSSNQDLYHDREDFNVCPNDAGDVCVFNSGGGRNERRFSWDGYGFRYCMCDPLF